MSALPDHSVYDAVLKDYVKKGVVEYDKLKNDKRFHQYINQIRNTSSKEISQKEIIPFWINVYNAYTLLLCSEHYPLKSIRDINLKGSDGKTLSAWDYPFVELKDKKLTLNDIENTILRLQNEPRIHFALVCAAKSCATLRSEAYTSKLLDKQLREQAIEFLTDPTKNSFDISTKVCQISKIFEWYRQDFGNNNQELIRYISQFLSEQIRKSLLTYPTEWKMMYKEYDWSLNE